jgi:hypothetical protein
MAVDELVEAIGVKFQISGERLAMLDLDAMLNKKLNENGDETAHMDEEESNHSSASDAETISAEQSNSSIRNSR